MGANASLSAVKSITKPGFDGPLHGDEDVIDRARGAELYKAHQALAVAWEGVGMARACAFSQVPFLELRGATDTANHEALIVLYVILKTVMKNIAYLSVRWLKH